MGGWNRLRFQWSPGLLGAIQGREADPVHWLRAHLSCRPVQGLPSVHHPRPKPLWPVDALELAERLCKSNLNGTP